MVETGALTLVSSLHLVVIRCLVLFVVPSALALALESANELRAVRECDE